MRIGRFLGRSCCDDFSDEGFLGSTERNPATAGATSAWQQQCPPAAATYQEFLSTQPLLFTKAEDPLDIDVWLRVVESKFPLLTGACPNAAKARFAAQQLRGPARTWWDHFLAMLPANHVVTWEEFKPAFRGHHIPAGILDRKLNEFLALTQGTRTMLQYAQAFNDMCQLRVTMQTRMRRRGTASEGDSAPNSVSTLTLFGPTTTTNWLTWPSHRKTASWPTEQRRRGRHR
jgi:hypothetical protein